MQKIGLFFGSFNPIHIGHLILAEYFADYTDLNEVWLVISPQNPFKQQQQLLDQYHRLDFCHMATADNPKLRVSDIEFGLSKPSYTVHTLLHLQAKHPDKTFVLLMGEDNLIHFKKWKNYEYILEKHQIYVYPRVGFEGEQIKHNAIKKFDAPIIEISSSFIRKSLKIGKSIRYYLPEKLHEYITTEQFYKK